MALNEGDILAGKYRIERLLGEGGMGAVYVATNQVLQKRVALKVMNERFASVPAAVERFLREAVAASRVSHAGIVQVFDAGEHDKKPWIAMELLEGESLGQRLERGPMSLGEVLAMAEGTLSALAEVHAEGIIHRDLKPDNIFLAKVRGGNGWVPKVLDFGVAKDTSDGQLSKLTATGAVVGTAHYLSPEQAKGLPDIDARADVYAMGVVLFEALSGKLPYEAESITQLIAKMFTEEPRSLREVAPHVPQPIADVVATCLRQDRNERFQTARALLGALRSATEAARSAGACEVAFAATEHAMPSLTPSAAAAAVVPGSHEPSQSAVPSTAAGTPEPSRRHPAATVPWLHSSLPPRPSEEGRPEVSLAPPPAEERRAAVSSRSRMLGIVLAVFAVGAAGAGLGAWSLLRDDGASDAPVARAQNTAAGGVAQTALTRQPGTVGSVAEENEIPAGVDAEPASESSEAVAGAEPPTAQSATTTHAVAPPEAVETAETVPPSEQVGIGEVPSDSASEPAEPSTQDRRRRRNREPQREAESTATPEPVQPPQEPQATPRPAPVPEAPPEPQPARPRPGLPHAAVVNTVQQRLPYLRERCYVRRLARVPGLQGVITIAWTIRPDGRVENAEVVHNGTGDEWLARCTRNVVSDIRFPVSPQGQPTPARYPFQFRTQ